MSFTTSAARRNPKVPTTGARVPLSAEISGEKAQRNFFAGSISAFFMRVRSALARGQPCTFQNSATSMRAGSYLRAAPMDEKRVAVDRVARWMSSILQSSESMASSM